MQVTQVIAAVQAALQIPLEQRAPHIGPLTRGAFNRLAQLPPDARYSTGLDEPFPTIVDIGHAGDVSTGARDINSRAVQLIQHFESCSLKAYADEVGVWTIGWGHTGLQHKDGTVYPGRTITQEKADQLFRYDMEQFESRVSAFAKVALNDDQYGALVAFDFNTGGLDRSSLLKKLNAGDYQGAADGLLQWNKAGGKVLNGLTRRRASERRLFDGCAHFILADMDEVRADAEGKLA